mgnify:CR=1 FL=1
MQSYVNQVGLFFRSALRPNKSRHYLQVGEQERFLVSKGSDDTRIMAPAFQRMPSVPENGDDGLEMEEAISIKVATLMTGETGIETIETTTHSSALEDDGGNIKNAANDRMAKSRLTSPDSSKNEGEESLQGEPMTMVPLEMATSEEEEGDLKPPMKQSSRVNQKGFLLTSMDSFLIDWFYSILIGALVVSYWRVSVYKTPFKNLNQFGFIH